MLPWCSSAARTVLLRCPPALRRLLAGVAGVDRLLAEGEALPHSAMQAALLSLPGLLETRLDTIPAQVPYLGRNRTGSNTGARNWSPWAASRSALSGKATPGSQATASAPFPCACFEALARVEGVRLVSLQKGPGAEQLQALAGRFAVLDLGDRLEDFVDAAAVVKNLDLVVSVDTAVAHLAGALAAPVWLALPFAPDWRWLLEREDSPWYPHHRLFRQRRRGDWDEVFQRIEAELQHPDRQPNRKMK